MLREIPIEGLKPNPTQPRTHFEGIEELAASLKAEGQLTPLLVRPVDGHYEIVHGERRWRAAQLAGLMTLRAEVREISDDEVFRIALIENVQRENLNAIDEARAYQRLQDEGLTQTEVGEVVGRTQSYVAGRLALLGLPEDIQWRIMIRIIPPSVGRMLAAVEDAELQRQLADSVADEDLSLREFKRRRRKAEAELWLQRRELPSAEMPVSDEVSPAERLGQMLTLSTRLSDEEKRQRSKLTNEEWRTFTRSVWSYSDTVSRKKRDHDHPAAFSAEVARRLIKLYSCIDDIVLDPFVGSGTTTRQAMGLSRFPVGVDINPHFVAQARVRSSQTHTPLVMQGDARGLCLLPDQSVHLVVAHPPYWNVVRCSDLPDDLANIDDYGAFLREVQVVFGELHRVLRPERMLCVVTGDVFRSVDGVGRLHSLHSDYVRIAEGVGFALWDSFIWETRLRLKPVPIVGSYPYPGKPLSQHAHNHILVLRRS